MNRMNRESCMSGNRSNGMYYSNAQNMQRNTSYTNSCSRNTVSPCAEMPCSQQNSVCGNNSSPCDNSCEMNTGCCNNDNTSGMNNGCCNNDNTCEMNTGCCNNDNTSGMNSGCCNNDNSCEMNNSCCNNGMDVECMPSKKDPVSCMPLAMAYVPWQDYESIYSESEAWSKGTIFCQLDKDFMARRCN